MPPISAVVNREWARFILARGLEMIQEMESSSIKSDSHRLNAAKMSEDCLTTFVPFRI